MSPRGTPTKVIGVRFTEEEQVRVLKAAKAVGQPPSTWVNAVAVAAAEATVKGPWWCDRCRKPITKVRDGWLQWRCRLLEDETTVCDKIEIVHHGQVSPVGDGGCYPRGFEKSGTAWSDHHLDQFTGPAGAMRLLVIAEDNPPLELLIEVMNRLLVPGYEVARHHLPRAIADGHIEPGTRLDHDLIGPILQEYGHE